MRSTLFLAALLVSALSCDEHCQWANWKAKYAKSYSTPEEEGQRFAVFRTNVAEYARRNAEPGQTAVYGADEFADLSREEFAARFLMPEAASKFRRFTAREAPEAPLRRQAFQSAFLTPYASKARQQGGCGSCWAFASAAVIEGANMRATNNAEFVSPQNMLDCANYGGNWDGCSGYNAGDMLWEIASKGKSGGGIMYDRNYQYAGFMGSCKHALSSPGDVQVDGYFTEKFNEAEGSGLYSRLMQYGSLAIALNAGNVQGYQGGVIRHSSNCLYTQLGYYASDHAVTLVGWGEQGGVKYWVVKNSWGATWGEPKDYTRGGTGEGYFRIQRGVGACHITDDAAVGVTVAGNPGPGPEPCTPKTKEAACGSRRCGSVDNGCGSPLACGYCSSGQACSASGTCDDVDSELDWVQVSPPQSQDFLLAKSSEGVTISTSTGTSAEKMAQWKTSGNWISESWTSFSAQVRAGAAGVVGLGMRQGQSNAPLNGLSWKISIPSYGGGGWATAYLLQCFYYGNDQCSTVVQFSFAMDTYYNFTINYGLQYSSSGEAQITMRPFLNGQCLTGNYYYVLPRSYYPSLGSAFVVASGASKSFKSPRLITRTTVKVAMKSCHTADEWLSEVSRILRVPRSFVADVRGQRRPGSSCGDGDKFDSFNVTLLDSNATTGIHAQSATGVAALGQLRFSNALAEQLTQTVSGGGLEYMGVSGAVAEVVFPAAVGEATATAAIVGTAAAGAALSTGAVVGIAVGGGVALAVGASVAGIAVYAATRPEPREPMPDDFQPANPLRKTFYKVKASRGVDVMSNMYATPRLWSDAQFLFREVPALDGKGGVSIMPAANDGFYMCDDGTGTGRLVVVKPALSAEQCSFRKVAGLSNPSLVSFEQGGKYIGYAKVYDYDCSSWFSNQPGWTVGLVEKPSNPTLATWIAADSPQLMLYIQDTNYWLGNCNGNAVFYDVRISDDVWDVVPALNSSAANSGAVSLRLYSNKSLYLGLDAEGELTMDNDSLAASLKTWSCAGRVDDCTWTIVETSAASGDFNLRHTASGRVVQSPGGAGTITCPTTNVGRALLSLQKAATLGFWRTNYIIPNTPPVIINTSSSSSATGPSPSCSDFVLCRTCITTDMSCGWCAETDMCTHGTATAPVNCSASKWFFDSCIAAPQEGGDNTANLVAPLVGGIVGGVAVISAVVIAAVVVRNLHKRRPSVLNVPVEGASIDFIATATSRDLSGDTTSPVTLQLSGGSSLATGGLATHSGGSGAMAMLATPLEAPIYDMNLSLAPVSPINPPELPPPPSMLQLSNAPQSLSVRLAILILVSVCVVVSVAPQLGLWYSTATSSTHMAAEKLLQSISNASIAAFSSMAADAENAVSELSDALSQRPSSCVPGAGGILGVWPQALDISRTGSRGSWYIGIGDKWNFHVGTYGVAPQPSYARPEPVIYLQDPSRWSGWLVSFYLRPNKTSGTWYVADNTGQNSSTYSNFARPWFQTALAYPGTVRWGDIFMIVPEGYLVMSASTSWSPLGVDPARTTCGAISAMMSLDAIGKYLRDNRAGASDVWLVSNDADRSIIASSTDALAGTAAGDRIPIEQSEHKLTRRVGAAARRLRNSDRINTLATESLGGRSYNMFVRDFVDVRPGTGFPAISVIVAVPESVYLGRIQSNIKATIGIAVGMFLASALASALVGVLISTPLRKVVRQMERAAALETVRGSGVTTSGSLSELSSISSSMQKMWVLLASFHRYVPMEVLRILQKKGEVAQLSVQRKQTTIMFCDVENFTPLTEETTDSAVLLQVLTEFMDICTECIDETQGLVDKFIGDCVMAFWGYPGEEEATELRAVQCALLIQQRLSKARVQWNVRGLPVLNCRIGVATGFTLVGNSGSSNHFHYTVLGAPVNLAARLEPLNKAFGTHVLVCSSTWNSVAAKVVGRCMGRCRIKGFSAPLNVYEPVCAVETADLRVAEAVAAYNDAMAELDVGHVQTASMHLQNYLAVFPQDQFACNVARALLLHQNHDVGTSFSQRVLLGRKGGPQDLEDNDPFVLDTTAV
eukprot:m51a1_g2962 hypothetical protein (2034) ;mRNA; f:677286-685865